MRSTQLVWPWFSWTSVTTWNLRNHCHHFTPTLYYILVILLGSLQSYLSQLFTYLVPFGNATWKRVKQNVHNQAISTRYRCCALTWTFSNTLWWYFLLWRLYKLHQLLLSGEYFFFVSLRITCLRGFFFLPISWLGTWCREKDRCIRPWTPRTWTWSPL